MNIANREAFVFSLWARTPNLKNYKIPKKRDLNDNLTSNLPSVSPTGTEPVSAPMPVKKKGKNKDRSGKKKKSRKRIRDDTDDDEPDPSEAKRHCGQNTTPDELEDDFEVPCRLVSTAEPDNLNAPIPRPNEDVLKQDDSPEAVEPLFSAAGDQCMDDSSYGKLQRSDSMETVLFSEETMPEEGSVVGSSTSPDHTERVDSLPMTLVKPVASCETPDSVPMPGAREKRQLLIRIKQLADASNRNKKELEEVETELEVLKRDREQLKERYITISGKIANRRILEAQAKDLEDKKLETSQKIAYCDEQSENITMNSDKYEYAHYCKLIMDISDAEAVYTEQFQNIQRELATCAQQIASLSSSEMELEGVQRRSKQASEKILELEAGQQRLMAEKIELEINTQNARAEVNMLNENRNRILNRSVSSPISSPIFDSSVSNAASSVNFSHRPVIIPPSVNSYSAALMPHPSAAQSPDSATSPTHPSFPLDVLPATATVKTEKTLSSLFKKIPSPKPAVKKEIPAKTVLPPQLMQAMQDLVQSVLRLLPSTKEDFVRFCDHFRSLISKDEYSAMSTLYPFLQEKMFALKAVPFAKFHEEYSLRLQECGLQLADSSAPTLHQPQPSISPSCHQTQRQPSRDPQPLQSPSASSSQSPPTFHQDVRSSSQQTMQHNSPLMPAQVPVSDSPIDSIERFIIDSCQVSWNPPAPAQQLSGHQQEQRQLSGHQQEQTSGHQQEQTRWSQPHLPQAQNIPRQTQSTIVPQQYAQVQVTQHSPVLGVQSNGTCYSRSTVGRNEQPRNYPGNPAATQAPQYQQYANGYPYQMQQPAAPPTMPQHMYYSSDYPSVTSANIGLQNSPLAVSQSEWAASAYGSLQKNGAFQSGTSYGRDEQSSQQMQTVSSYGQPLPAYSPSYAYAPAHQQHYGTHNGSGLSDPRGCVVCGAPAAEVCSRCSAVTYCGKKCQVEDWPQHRKSCMDHVKFSPVAPFV